MKKLGTRIRRQMERVNPTVWVGVILLVAGLVMSIVRLSSAPSGDRAVSLNRAISGIIQFTQRAILWGDDAVGDPQFKFNAAFVAVFVEELSPQQQRALGTIASMLQSLLGDLFSLKGLATLGVLAIAYFAVSRYFDQRFPEIDGT